ncbi:hypothetical protein GCM10010430_43790 [Kitasatospora cystarginea]|uniref:Transcriptional regulator n=1 Tax=Kitasatospora cystarginea TaxID=58350 RepID=A0ABN3EE45_9ACTN
MTISPDGIGNLLHAARKATGRSRVQQAEHLTGYKRDGHFDPENLKRWETERRLPQPLWYPLLSAGYDIPIGEIRRAVEASRRYRRLTEAMTENAQTGDRTLGADAKDLATGAAAQPWGRLSAALIPPQVDEGTVEDAASRTTELHALGQIYPAGMLTAPVHSHLDYLTSLLSVAGDHRAEIALQAAGTAALAGYTAFELGGNAEAFSYYEVARYAAREAGHPPLLANVMADMSYALTPRKAADILADAQHHTKGGPGLATAAAWLAALEAEHAASTGQRERALMSLERAYARYEEAHPDTDQLWTKFFTEGRLHARAVSVYSFLNHPALDDAVTKALLAAPQTSSREDALVMASCAHATARAGELDRAAKLALDAAQINQAIPSRPTADHLTAVLEILSARAHRSADPLRATLS